MQAAPAAGSNPYGLIPALQQGGIIAISVFTILVLMSIFSFYILFTKLMQQQKIISQGRKVRASFWNSPNLRDAATKLEAKSAYRAIVDDALLAQDQHGKLTDPIDQHDWMANSLARSQGQISSRLGEGLAFLATVGSTAPFIGLFGTVVGILNAFQQIATQKTSGIGAVAGGISEALVTTAFGLLVAIPAVMTFNYFTNKVEAFDVEMDNSSSELVDYFIKQSHQ